MSRPLFTNNAATNLAEPITPLSTVLQVTAGTGGYFPQPSIGDYFMLTLVQANNPSVSEIVECIGRSGDILTVVRGQEGTAPQTFNLSDNVELRITASSLNLFAIGGGSGGTASGTSVANFTATAGQTVFTLPWSYTQGIENLAIFVNGSKQIVNVNYVETSTTSFTMASGLNVGDLVQAIYNLPLSGGIINSSNVVYNEGSAGAVNSTVQVKLQETVSVKDFGAVGNGTTNDAAAIQAALNTGKSVLVPAGQYFLGTANSGNFLTITADGQCIVFEDNAEFIANGNNGVTNSAAVIANDSFSNVYLYNPYISSNGTSQTTADRDSPYGFVVTCTTATVNNVGIINGHGKLLQGMFQTAKTTMDAYEVNGINVDYFSEDCYYGFGLSATGNGVVANINALNAQRPFIIYGCNNVNLVVDANYTNTSLPKASSIIGAGVITANTKDTYAINAKVVYKGYPLFSGIRCSFSVQHFAAQATKCKMYDINLNYNDRDATAGNSIGFTYTIDGVVQASYTGNIFDRITIEGYCFARMNLTTQGATPGGVPLAQTVKGYSDMGNLKINGTITGIYDPFLYLFSYGYGANNEELRAWTPVVAGLTTAGTCTYTTRSGLYTIAGGMCYFSIAVAWTGHTGTGNLTVSLPYNVAAGFSGVSPLWSQTITYTGIPQALPQANTAYLFIGNSTSGAGLTFLAVQAAGTLSIQGSFQIK